MNDSSSPTPPNSLGSFFVRSATPAPESASTDVEIDRPTDGKMAADPEAEHIDAFSRRHGRPYIVDVLDILPAWNRLGMDQELHAIDGFILSEIREGNLKPTKQTYDSQFYKLKSELSIDPDVNFDEVVTQLDALVRMKQELKLRKLMKAQFGV